MCIAFPQSWILIETEDNQTPPSFSKPWKYMSRVKDGGSWEGYFLPSPSSRGDHTLLRRTQGRVVRARESTADNRLPFTALTATSCFASQPNPLLFFSSQQKDFSKFLPCEHAPCLSTLFSSPLSTLFSHFTFPPSLAPLLRSHVCVVHLSLPRLLTLHHPPHWDGPLFADVSHSHSCLKQSTASAFPIFTFRQHNT